MILKIMLDYLMLLTALLNAACLYNDFLLLPLTYALQLSKQILFFSCFVFGLLTYYFMTY